MRALPLLVACLGACVHFDYEGPRREPNEIATIEEDGTVVEYLDGRRARPGQVHEVLPGRHMVGIRLYDVDNHILYERLTYSHVTLIVCLDARAGHAYVTQAAIKDRRWLPVIVDKSVGAPVDVSCGLDRASASVEDWRIDLQEGKIPVFADGVLSPGMSREAFLKIVPLALVANESVIYASYRFGPFKAGGRDFVMIATFAKDKLWAVDLTDAGIFGQDRDLSETTKSKERARNEEWLSDSMGISNPRFAWGSVQSRLDKNGVPIITVRYF
jgi:hypothetical protein